MFDAPPTTVTITITPVNGPLVVQALGTTHRWRRFGLAYGARFLSPLLASARAWRVLDGVIGTTMFVLAALPKWHREVSRY